MYPDNIVLNISAIPGCDVLQELYCWLENVGWGRLGWVEDGVGERVGWCLMG